MISQEFEQKLITIRRDLHKHPETGFNEHWTSAYLANILREAGLEVHENIALTGIVAVIPGRDRSRSVAYRADIDALPIQEKLEVPWKSQNGCMHACGHDFHMAIALGTALSMVHEPQACDIAFVFQPNEEGAPGEGMSGAESMCQEGILEKFHIRRMIALHCDPSLLAGKMGVCDGALWAAAGRFVVRIAGKAAHAAYPERSHDALWAASEMVSAIYAALRRRRAPNPEVVSICKFNAGAAFNIIAECAQFEGTMRAPSRDDLDALSQILRETCEAVAAMCHVHVDYEMFYGAQAVINDREMAHQALEVWQKTNSAQTITMSMASEDFSHFSSRIPCFYAMLGIRDPQDACTPPLHANNFCANDAVIPFAVERMREILEVFSTWDSAS